MGMRKKIRNVWKADRKVNIASRRKAKAIRLVKATAAGKVAKTVIGKTASARSGTASRSE